MIRPFDLRDLPVLRRYHRQEVCLDSTLKATRGQVLTQGALLSFLTPATGIFTWVYSDNRDKYPLMGQISHQADSPFARISFLAPKNALSSPKIGVLLEKLIQQAGQRGAFNLLAEIDERSTVFEALRKNGFSIYARQRIWKMPEGFAAPLPKTCWETAGSRDTLAVQLLYNNVVPGLVQQIEPHSTAHLRGLVCQKDEDLIGYVDLKYGPRGIWAQPFIHPDIENINVHLHGMLGDIPDRRARPLYICVRSYQFWLEPALDELGASPGPLQAVMVKRLAIHHKITRSFALPKIEGQTKVSTPIFQGGYQESSSDAR
jgi:hypothetical protein